MFCDEALDAVEAVAAGDRTPDGRLAAHYASCPNCATALASARELERLLHRRSSRRERCRGSVARGGGASSGSTPASTWLSR